MIQELTVINPDPKTWRLIRDHTIFHQIGDDEVRNILPFFKLVVAQPGEIFIEEGHDPSMNLYLILEGNMDVLKKADDGEETVQHHGINKEFTIARLTAGDAIGELSFIKGNPRSASIRCVTKSVLLGLDPNELKRLEEEYPRTSNTMMKNMVGYVGDRLRQTSTNEVKGLKIQLQRSIMNSKANLFFSYVIGLLCVYNLTIHLITNLSKDVNMASIISALIIVIFCVVLVFMIKQSKLPVHIFGLTRRNWKPALTESVVWSAVIIAILIALKWILINNVPRYRDLPLFDFDLKAHYLAFNFILYSLHSPIQEFIARGVLQGSLQHFFGGKNVTIRAILVSNALFSATHVHLMSGLLALAVFIPGLFWGWLYSRHKNLIGVSVSHLLIGWFTLFFLNFESLF